MVDDIVETKDKQPFSERAASKGLDAGKLQASLDRIGKTSSNAPEPIRAQGGAGVLDKALEAQRGPSPAQRVGEAVAQEERRGQRINESRFGIPDTGGSLPSQSPPAETAPGWIRHQYEEIQRGQQRPSPEEQAEIEKIDAANLAKAQGVTQEKTEEPVK